MTITHHLSAASLIGYAAGTLPSALAAVANAHIAMCPHCQNELVLCERIGGALLEGLAPTPLAAAQPALPPARVTAPARPDAGGGHATNPILALAAQDFVGVTWRRIGVGLWHRPLPIKGKGSLQLIKAAPGAMVPDHGHAGGEFTLILRGAMSDATGRYRAGDVADLDEEVEHTPVADAAAGCICAVANEAPSRFHSLLARLLQPWHGL